MTKKTHFQPHFGLFSKNLGPQNYFCEFYLYYNLEVVPIYHHVQFKGELINQTWENGKNLVSSPVLVWLTQIWTFKMFFVGLPLVDLRYCCKLSLHALSRRTSKLILRKWIKKLISCPILALSPGFGFSNFFHWFYLY